MTTWQLLGVCCLQVALFLQVAKGATPFLNGYLVERTACQTPSFDTTYSDAADFNQQALDWHNYFRCQHDVPLMTLDNDLKASAQAFADHLASTAKWEHSTTRCGVGENLWAVYGTEKPAAWLAVRGDATFNNPAWGVEYGNGWYCSEYSYYNWAGSSYQSTAGHFTQVVWQSSTRLGCGVAAGDTDYGIRAVVVCHYADVGNLSSSSCWSGDNAKVVSLKSGVSLSTVCPSTNA